jgi:hypothetical protein
MTHGAQESRVKMNEINSKQQILDTITVFLLLLYVTENDDDL